MKIKDLIKQLKAYPEETVIYISGDEEGNDYHNIDGVYSHEGSDKEDKIIPYVVIYPDSDYIDL